jgi:hypothetical protein
MVTEFKNCNYKGYKLRTKECLSLTRFTNKIFLNATTKCVRPSAIFHISYPDLPIIGEKKVLEKMDE